MTNSGNRDPLTEQVRELLVDLLRQADFPGSNELLQQASNVNVIGGPVTMLELQVTRPVSASAFTEGQIPLSAVVSDTVGRTIGELLVWVESGELNALEFAWWTDDPPDQLPAPDHVRVARK